MRTTFSLLSLLLFLSACSATTTGPTGDLAFFLEAEETITDGLMPGTGVENIVDGYTVTYEHFVVALGHVHAESRASGAGDHDETVWLVDLVSAPATGIPLVTFESLPIGTYDDVGFETPVATATAVRHDSVSQALFDEMVLGGCTYLLEGTVDDGTDTTSFRFCIPAATTFGPCSTPDGMEGVVVTAGGTTNTSITLHGDHMWFNAFPSGDELIERRAGWLVACDADADGMVTEAELRAADPAVVFPSADYNLSGAPVAIESAWDFLVAQIKTQGHLNGEGECPWDGAAHMH